MDKLIEPAWLKPKKAAIYAGISERTFRSWLKQGLVYSRMPSGMMLVHRNDIDDFIRRYQTSEDEVEKMVDSFLKDL